MDMPESCERLCLPPQTLSLRRFPSDPAGKKHLPSGELPLELAAQLLSALQGGRAAAGLAKAQGCREKSPCCGTAPAECWVWECSTWNSGLRGGFGAGFRVSVKVLRVQSDVWVVL